MFRRIPHPSPAMLVAMLALMVALSGTAVAAGVVPLAKRALIADNAKNAKKLGGQTAAAVVSRAAAVPGPASSAAGLVTIKTGTWSVAPGAIGDFTVTCDPGQKAIGYGWEDTVGLAHAWDTRPSSDGGSWKLTMTVSASAPGQQSGPLYAVCLK